MIPAEHNRRQGYGYGTTTAPTYGTYGSPDGGYVQPGQKSEGIFHHHNAKDPHHKHTHSYRDPYAQSHPADKPVVRFMEEYYPTPVLANPMTPPLPVTGATSPIGSPTGFNQGGYGGPMYSTSPTGRSSVLTAPLPPQPALYAQPYGTPVPPQYTAYHQQGGYGGAHGAKKSEITIVQPRYMDANPLVESIMTLSHGELPHNEHINRTLELSKLALDNERLHDPLLNERGRKLAQDLEMLLAATQQFILDKNGDERIQQMYLHGKWAASDVGNVAATGIKSTAMPLRVMPLKY